MLLWSHNLSYGFYKLTRVVSCYFLIDFFFNFIHKYEVEWELNFIICFAYILYEVIIIS
jgi:hypothetical protein